jgi:L-alanine-DL-glutamate epimerase-like enolase superfamily enzyme
MQLAAGENMRGLSQFHEAIDSGAFGVIQPDLGKWGGFSGCIPVARSAIQHQKLFCPHWLGGGIGLIASMHLKAAVGGPGFVEVDSNPNPLRELLANPLPKVSNSEVCLSDQAGLGIEPDLLALKPFLINIL